MSALPIWLLIVLILIAIPTGLLAVLGLVVLVLKIVTIVQKAAEPPTVDESGRYSLDQGKDVGQDR